jgi:hypothetical protein
LTLLIYIHKAQAQTYNDARLWLSLNIQKKLTKKFSVNFTESLRMHENYTQVGQIYSDLGMKYKISKKWKIEGHYRLSKNRKNHESFSLRSRFYADLAYKQKVGKRLEFTLRTRYQRQYTNYNRSIEGRTPQDHLRFKLTMNIDLNKRYTPYVAGELFYQLSNTVYKNKFDQTRYFVGVLYDIDKKKQIDVHYIINSRYNSNNIPAMNYILSLNYYYSF